MSEFIGRQIDFGLAVESARGTAEATPNKNVKKVTASLRPRVEKVVDDSTFGRLEDSENARVVREWSEAEVEGIVHADVVGYYFNNLYGDVTTVEVDTGVYEHIFTLQQDIIHPTLTCFINEATVRQEKMANGVLSSFEVNATTDNFVRYTASLLGKNPETDSSTYPALENEYDFIGRDITVKVAETEAGLSGATPLKLKDLSVTWETNAEADFVFGSKGVDNIYNKQFTLTGSFTKNYTDNTFLDLYNSDDYRYMQITIAGETAIGTEVPTIDIMLYKVSITDHEGEKGADDLVTESVSFKAYFSTADDQQSQVSLINETVTY